MRGVHICRFDSTEDLRGKARTYKAVKEAALNAGRFSIFEATSTDKNARIFDTLMKDPDVEHVELPYPWVGVRRKSEVAK